jgi:hypothetical protein
MHILPRPLQHFQPRKQIGAATRILVLSLVPCVRKLRTALAHEHSPRSFDSAPYTLCHAIALRGAPLRMTVFCGGGRTSGPPRPDRRRLNHRKTSRRRTHHPSCPRPHHPEGRRWPPVDCRHRRGYPRDRCSQAPDAGLPGHRSNC